jgi:divalent anion:Na+ symporter, DASS family
LTIYIKGENFLSTLTTSEDTLKVGGERKEALKKVLFILLAIGVALLIGFLPTETDAMSRNALAYLGIFSGLLVLFFTKAVPDWAAALTAMCFIVICGIGKINDTFASFGQSTVWLIIGVFGFSVGLNNSGLFKRLSLKILNLFPKNYKGQILAIFTTGLCMSPLLPSVQAKSSILLPISTEVSAAVGFEPKSKQALGMFTAAFLPSYFFGMAFLTGSAYVAIMLGFIKIKFSWLGWLGATWPWLIIAVVLTYLFCTIICRPDGKQQDLPADFITKKLEELGPMVKKEKQALVILVVALVFWLTQTLTGIDAGMIALLAMVAMLTCGLMDTKDFSSKIPWGTIVFIGALLSVSSFMSSTKAGDWFATLLGPVVSPIISSPWIFVPALCIITFAIRYVIVSQLVTLAVLLAIFTPFLQQSGISIFVVVWVVYMSSLVWNVPYQSPVIMGVIPLAGNKFITYNEARKASYLYMIICLVGMTASIPIWKALGLC